MSRREPSTRAAVDETALIECLECGETTMLPNISVAYCPWCYAQTAPPAPGSRSCDGARGGTKKGER
jgi:hypothetical protein